MLHIVQHGLDGVGHQLQGLLSCLALHGVKDYYFDGCVFVNKRFHFQHLTNEMKNDVEKYVKEIGKRFMEMHEQKPISQKAIIYSHEVYKIPTNYDSYTLYSLDNAYYFNRIPINQLEITKFKSNIVKYRDLFINDKLPQNRLKSDNIVIHFREGDAIKYPERKADIDSYKEKLVRLCDVLPNSHTYYIHTDGDVKFLTDILNDKGSEYLVYRKDEHILNVLSDFIHSSIFVASPSSLSIVCTFLGDHDLVIVADDIKQSLPDYATRITDYLALDHTCQ